MRIILSVCFFLVLLIACTSKNRVPLNILKPEKMVPILWDMARADEYATNFLVIDSTTNKEKERIWLYNQILRIHKTNENEFKKSIAYYENHPGLMKIVMDSLSVMDKHEERLKLKEFKKKGMLKVKKDSSSNKQKLF